MNLYQKLAKIRKMSGVIQKSKQGYGYKYVPEDEVLAKISAGMEKYNVSLIPMIRSESSHVEPYQYVDKKGKNAYEILVTADMQFKWVDDENPEDFIIVDWLLTGQQSDSSQAFGAGLTYCQRYFLLKYFQIATVDADPDQYRSKQQAAEDFEADDDLRKVQREILKAAKAKTDAGIDKQVVPKVISDHSGGNKNPNAIKDIEVAQKVLEIINAMEVTNE